MTEIEKQRLAKLIKETKPTTEKKPVNNIANDCVVWIGDQSACKIKESTPEERLKLCIEKLRKLGARFTKAVQEIETINSRTSVALIDVGRVLRDQGVPKTQRMNKITELFSVKDDPILKRDLTEDEKKMFERGKQSEVNYAVAQQRRITELFGSDTDLDMFR